MQKEYDLAVIGAGPGGYTAAVRAAKYGMKTVVIESRELGGTCLNRGCVPTKALLHASRQYREMKDSGILGVHAQGVSYDPAEMYARKEDVVRQLRGGIGQLFQMHKIDSIIGRATITGEHEITVTGSEEKQEKQKLSVKKILIAAGSNPARPPIPGIDLPGVVTSDELLANPKLYAPLIIIGGGVIGMEFASIYSALGIEVTVIEAMERVLPLMDKELSQNLSMILKKRGVKIVTSARVEQIRKENGLTCTFVQKGISQSVSGEGVLVAIGRRPNTDGLFGSNIAVSTERGAVTVNEDFQSSVPSIYAIGDVIQGIQLAHMASAQAVNAVAAMLGKTKPENLSVVPSCVYTDPEIACVGLTAEEAKGKGIAVKAGKYLMSANAKTLITRQERGFIKIVLEEESHVVLGAQLMCARATDLVSELTAAIGNGFTCEQLFQVIRPHPTFSEGISEAAGSLFDQ